MDTMLARQLTQRKSESSFTRYSKRELEVKAHRQFSEVFGEQKPGSETDVLETSSLFHRYNF